MTFQEIQVGVERPYVVHVGSNAIACVAELPKRWSSTFVLTDANVAGLHGAVVRRWPRTSVHVIPAGEESKGFRTLERVLDAMVAAGCDRSSGLVALGGGVVGDLGGLAAALFHRGIDCAQVPTTLLAMVDSSVGGKTAVNLSGGKNLAGVFHQPIMVAADMRFLATLPAEEFRSGLGEVVKTAVLDGDLFHRLVASAGDVAGRVESALAEVITACVRRKAAIVRADPRELGERKLLNLGHTFGHAIEHAAGFGTIPHGVAVATGIVLAVEAGRSAGLAVDPRFAERLRELLQALDVPASLNALHARYGKALTAEELLAAMARDKKARRGTPRFVVPSSPGAVAFDVELPEAALRAAIEHSAGG
ncbi:MAG: 3-dehydroquinate synthase [Planctomycetes bacterium]|nr:3-dehydroquinate synthase [Planctomycetota bacterium]